MHTRYLLLDLETAPLSDVEQWLPPVDADKRLSDPVKVANDLATKKAAQIDTAGLDPDLCRIVAAGWQIEHSEPELTRVLSEDMERTVLESIWNLVGPSRPMVGYGLSWFDAGVLVRRSQLLGVDVPPRVYEQGKYRHPLIVELGDFLTLNGMIEQKKGRGLDYHCKRLGIQVEDGATGKDVAALWKAGDIGAILAHLAADMTRIRLLSERLGVIPVATAEEVGLPL